LHELIIYAKIYKTNIIIKGDVKMIISTKTIVSNSDMIKNYKSCRDRADDYGKLFVLKNNQPDAVLMSIAEYERLSDIIEYFDSLDEESAIKFVESLPKNRLLIKYDTNHSNKETD
jgi:PHD/YefM family antitoxin component YafN of YafNO toxin-antitoxin module